MPGGKITLALQHHNEMLELRIENSATDIPKDLTEKGFDRFYRGDSARNRQVDGLGLGLNLCREIATLHQSTLTLGVTPALTVIASLHVPLKRADTK
jgi:signal transduction histidine kinase